MLIEVFILFYRNLARQLSLPITIDVNPETLEIKVVHSNRFYDTHNLAHCPVYRTRSKHRGIAFIINNINFERDEERKGAHMDGKNLRELFHQCHFKVTYLENQKAAEIKEAVLKLARDKDLNLYDMAFFVFMSHGKENVYKQSELKGIDGECVEECWIESQFSNKNCPALLNKPKIFIFQMCR